MKIGFIVNGVEQTVESDPARRLLDVLREDLGLTGTKYGCGEGQCRACTVLIDGEPAVACLLPVANVQNRSVETIEGLSRDGALHPVQQAFIEADAMQCGYCIPGMILQTVALLREHEAPSEERIIQALNGNLCRCAGYLRILEAVERAAGRKPAEDRR